MKMEPIVSSETSAIRTQTPGNYPKEQITFEITLTYFEYDVQVTVHRDKFL